MISESLWSTRCSIQRYILEDTPACSAKLYTKHPGHLSSCSVCVASQSPFCALTCCKIDMQKLLNNQPLPWTSSMPRCMTANLLLDLRCMHGWGWIRPEAFSCTGLPAAARPRWPMPSPMSAMCHSCASPRLRSLRECQVYTCLSAEPLQDTACVGKKLSVLASVCFRICISVTNRSASPCSML